jgi:hypothetical protein
MTGGVGLSVREREREPCAGGAGRGAGPSAGAGERAGALLGRSARLDQKERRESARVRFCFSFSKL